MRRSVRRMVVGAIAALTTAASGVVAAPAENEGVWPTALRVADVTGDGVDDYVVGQARSDDITDELVRLFDGATGKVLWHDVVRHVRLPVLPVTLGDGGRGLVVSSLVSGGPADSAEYSLRIRVVDARGTVRWDRTFDAEMYVGTPVPTYVRPAWRGVLRRPGAPDALLIESRLRVEGAATRLTRVTGMLVDAATGETVAEHGPYEAIREDIQLLPVPAAGAGEDTFATVTFPTPGIYAGPGTLTVYDIATGEQRWAAAVRANDTARIDELVAGSPPAPALSLTSYFPEGVGIQLLDPETGAKIADRTTGGSPQLADVAGEAGRLRSRYFSTHGEPNGYTVELLDLTGAIKRREFFPVGESETYTFAEQGFFEAGDVDGDGWLDLLVHALYDTEHEDPANDDRLVDGRTLRSAEVARNVGTLVWTGPGSAAVDGRGDDLYVLAGHRVTVLDGRTRRPLLRVAGDTDVSAAFGVRDRGASCADVVVVTYRGDDFDVTRLGPRGEVRWTTRPGSVRARDVSGTRGCATRPRAAPPAPAGPTIPATGGLPGAAAAVVFAGAALAIRRRRVA